MSSIPSRFAVNEGFDLVDIAEIVADQTNGPEPSPEEVQKWLDNKHADALAEAMHYAGCQYIKENWG